MADLHSPVDWLRWIARSVKRLVVLAVGVAFVGADRKSTRLNSSH